MNDRYIFSLILILVLFSSISFCGYTNVDVETPSIPEETTTTLPDDVVTYLEMLQGIKINLESIENKVTNDNNLWINEEVTYEEAKILFYENIQLAINLLNNFEEIETPAYKNIENSHEIFRLLVSELNLNVKYIYEELLAYDIGQQREHAYRVFTSNFSKLRNGIDRLILTMTTDGTISTPLLPEETTTTTLQNNSSTTTITTTTLQDNSSTTTSLIPESNVAVSEDSESVQIISNDEDKVDIYEGPFTSFDGFQGNNQSSLDDLVTGLPETLRNILKKEVLVINGCHQYALLLVGRCPYGVWDSSGTNPEGEKGADWALSIWISDRAFATGDVRDILIHEASHALSYLTKTCISPENTNFRKDAWDYFDGEEQFADALVLYFDGEYNHYRSKGPLSNEETEYLNNYISTCTGN